MNYYHNIKNVSYIQDKIEIDQTKMQKFIFGKEVDKFEIISNSILR